MKIKLPWPFFGFTGPSGQYANVVALQGPIRTTSERQALHFFRATATIIGFTSYTTFPSYYEPGAEELPASLFAGWCHCFREPDDYLPNGSQRSLISLSDFTDPADVSPDLLCPGADIRQKEWDFIYVCPDGPWGDLVKNWALALRCLPVLCCELSLNGLIVGRQTPAAERQNLTFLPQQQWNTLMRCLHKSRFLFVPNELDASPRIMAEALCMNVPILVNERILGGWKYVNRETGAFFRNEDDVGLAAANCLEQPRRPRAWFAKNFGPAHTGARLARFVHEAAPAVEFSRLGVCHSIESCETYLGGSHAVQ